MRILDQDDLFISMPDGARLAARLRRPEAGRHPAILEFIPYRRRDGTRARDETIHPWMAAQGYACLRVDLRGSGDSDGLLVDEYSPQELADAVAVIAWAAAQEWCTGAVGMMGKSWGGFNALQVAALNPPGLRAVVSVYATVDRFADDIHFKGGCLLGENFGWGSTMLSYQCRPPDPLIRPDWRELLKARLAALPHFAALWAAEQERGPYWRHGSVSTDWSALKLPILIVGGWADGYMNAPAALVRALPQAKAIVGPWVHQYPHTAVPEPRIDFLGELKQWWDRWLKGLPNGVEALPNYRVFMQDSHPPDPAKVWVPGRWLAETLPSSRVKPLALSLGADGRLGGQGAPNRIIASPLTAGANTGEYFPMGLAGEMPGDQSADDAHAVVFELDCKEGLALLGCARLELVLISDRPFAFVGARLCDVAPDGTALRIAHGFLNLRHRTEPPEPVPVGVPITVSFALDEMAHRLLPGHRLRLALFNACWPFVWPSPEAVRLQLVGGTVTLPVHPGNAPEWHFAAPPPVAPARAIAASPPAERRLLEINQIDGRHTLTISADSGHIVDPDLRLVTRSTVTETYAIAPHDPLSAEARAEWTQEHRREGWAVRSRARMRQWARREALLLEAELHVEIEEEGRPTEVIRHRLFDEVPRRHV